MGWIKLDDNFFSNKKIVTLTKDAKLMHLAALCYAGANLSDGVIPHGAVRIIAAQADVSTPLKLIRELQSAGLWNEHERGYEIHDYLKHNTSSAEVEAKREAARIRAEKRRNGEHNANRAESSQEVRANISETSQKVRMPETETETETETPMGGGADAPKAKRATQVPNDFALSENLIKWGAEPKQGFTVEQMESQIPRFIDHYRSKGEPRKDWDASFRTWMRNARDYGHLKTTPTGSLSVVSRRYEEQEIENPTLIGPERLKWEAQRWAEKNPDKARQLIEREPEKAKRLGLAS